MRFVIAIEEAVAGTFAVEANSADEALKLAEKEYKSGKIVLEPGELVCKQMAIVEPEKEATEWFEF